jgi:hypothetical protein
VGCRSKPCAQRQDMQSHQQPAERQRTNSNTAATVPQQRHNLLVGPQQRRSTGWVCWGANSPPANPAHKGRSCIQKTIALRHQKQRLLGTLLDSSASKRAAPNCTTHPKVSLYNSCQHTIELLVSPCSRPRCFQHQHASRMRSRLTAAPTTTTTAPCKRRHALPA